MSVSDPLPKKAPALGMASVKTAASARMAAMVRLATAMTGLRGRRLSRACAGSLSVCEPRCEDTGSPTTPASSARGERRVKPRQAQAIEPTATMTLPAKPMTKLVGVPWSVSVGALTAADHHVRKPVSISQAKP